MDFSPAGGQSQPINGPIDEFLINSPFGDFRQEIIPQSLLSFTCLPLASPSDALLPLGYLEPVNYDRFPTSTLLALPMLRSPQ